MKTILWNTAFLLFIILFLKLQIVDSHKNWKKHDNWEKHDDDSSSDEKHRNSNKKHSKNNQIREETRTLDQLYAAALKEGGRLILYAGGDLVGSMDGTKKAFEARFPNVTMDVVVDYSKFLGPRIDLQLANHSLVADAIQLQTVHEFPRWKAMGVLMPYKPAGWNAIYKDYRDPDGHFTGLVVYSFSNYLNSRLMPNQNEWPREAADYLKPKFAGGKLAVTYPNDDDAVLFWFRQVVDKYGWEWLAKFAKQEPIMVRGSKTAGVMVDNSTVLATMTTGGSLLPSNSTTSRFVLPVKDPFVMWAQQAAIFKDAKHPEAAKLYFNWALDKQQQVNRWPVRTDVPPAKGFRQSWEYTEMTSHNAFAKFMEDRDAIERFRNQIFFFLGEPKGDPSPGYPGLYADKALPH